MRSISEIANWFKKNNMLKDDIRIKLLCLHTIVAYKISNIDLEYEEIKFSKDSFDIGIRDIDTKSMFNDKELRILNTINHVYGYEDIECLLKHLSNVLEPSIDNIINYLYEEIEKHLDGFKYYDFDEYVLLLGNNVFFIKNNTILTEDEKDTLSKYDLADQDSFIVFRDTNNKLVVY